MPSPADPPKAQPHPGHADHPATASGRAAQVPVAGQLWQTSDGSVWRVVDVDLTRVDCFERVVLEIHESSAERTTRIASIVQRDREQPQMVTGDFAYEPSVEQYARMTVEPKWFEQQGRVLVGRIG